MNLRKEKGKLILTFKYDPRMVERCKMTGVEMKYSRVGGPHWWLPDNRVNRRILADVFPLLEPELKVKPIPIIDDTPPPDYMMAHQKEALEFSRAEHRHLFAHETGTGKTIVAIEIIRDKRAAQVVRKTLVVCPLGIINTAWMKDTAEFAPDLRVVNLWEVRGTTPARMKKMKKAIADMEVGVINFESFKKYREHLGRAAGVNMVIVDESSKIKNFKTAITKALIAHCDDVDYAYLFSGTPAPNNNLEYFPQARIINPMVLGRSFYKFRGHYYYSGGYQNHEWFPKKEMSLLLLDAIASFSSVVFKDDVLDLPERTFNTIDVHMTAAEKAAYKDMRLHLLTIIEDEEITAHNAAVKCMKLRQVTSGFLINEDGDPVPIGSSKMRTLFDLLETIGDHQVIIWAQFNYEARLIMENIESLGKTAGMVNGLVPQKVKDDNITRFKAGAMQYIIAHPRSMGHGQTLTNCTYSIYYSISHSHEEHAQSMDRVYRRGTTKPCTYYYLLAPGTVDKIIYGCLDKKQDAERAVLNHVKASRF